MSPMRSGCALRIRLGLRKRVSAYDYAMRAMRHVWMLDERDAARWVGLGAGRASPNGRMGNPCVTPVALHCYWTFSRGIAISLTRLPSDSILPAFHPVSIRVPFESHRAILKGRSPRH